MQKTHVTRRAAERGDSRAYGALAAPQREKRCSQRLIWRLSVATPGVRAASRRCFRCRAGGGSDWRSGRRRPRGNEGGSSREMLLLNKLQHLTAPRRRRARHGQRALPTREKQPAGTALPRCCLRHYCCPQLASSCEVGRAAAQIVSAGSQMRQGTGSGAFCEAWERRQRAL